MSHALDDTFREKRINTFNPSKRHKVFGGKLVLTERRREVLFHVASGDTIRWRMERDWSSSWRGDTIMMPYLGETGIMEILRFLRRHGLIRWMPRTTQLHITPRGMDALLEIVCP